MLDELDAATRAPAQPVRTLPVALGGLAVALQIAYPLTAGAVADRLTVVVVLVFAAACVAHAATTRGAPAAVSVLAGTAVPGFLVDVLGVHTGVPFGTYAYGDKLGTTVLGVPLVVGLAWTMLAWPAACFAFRVVDSFVARVLVGAWTLASFDVFLDPQMVAAGRWRWADPTPHLPGVRSVPLTNFGGWLAVGLLLSLGLQTLLWRRPVPPPRADAVILALFGWLAAGWVVALAVFLDLPAAAGWGAVAIGAVTVPLGIHRWRRHRGRA